MSYCVFFDLDETLLQCKSLLTVMGRFMKTKRNQKPSDTFTWETIISEIETVEKNHGRIEANQCFYKKFSGISQVEMQAHCQEWFIETRSTIFNLKALKELKKHQQQGAMIVIVSGSFEECIQPVAAELKINNVICNRLETREGWYTGNLLDGPVIGEGKSERITLFVKNNNCSFKGSYAYADDVSDIAMLSLVEHPVVVGNHASLIQYAQKRNWSIL